MSDQNKEVVFNTIEQCLTEGDKLVREAVTTGLLEALLSESDDGRLDFKLISNYLGSKTLEYCRAWDQFTGCDTPGL